jgi:hypothetical protein
MQFGKIYLVIVKGNVFVKKNQIGDFNWMIKQPAYKDILFIFNDNIEYVQKEVEMPAFESIINTIKN